jgi:hypothetical protein
VLSSRDERVLVGVSAAAGRGLERVARVVLDRDDSVTEAIRAAAASTDAFRELVAVLERHHAREWQFHLLDLIVEVEQQDLERRGERRTYHWPESGGRPVTTFDDLGGRTPRPSGAGRGGPFLRRPARAT